MISEREIKNLEKEIQAAIKGEVKFDAGYRALYATDSSNYRQVPIGVVFPKTKEDIIKTVSLCNKYDAPILCRGGGTSLAGQCCNVAVVMDFSKYYNRILHFSKVKKLVTVEPGIVLDDLRKEAEKFDLTFGPDPATHNHCTLGGMIGNNSCGVHSVMASWEGDGARTGDFIEEMEVLTYDGNIFTVGKTTEEEFKAITSSESKKAEIYKQLRALADKYKDLIKEKYPKIPRRVSGYNLDELFPEKKFNVARALAGTESTCVIILSATLQLIKFHKERSLVVLGYKDVYESARHITQILEHKPVGLEGVDNKLITFMHKKHLHEDSIQSLPEGKGWLWVEFGGDTKEEVEEKARKLMDSIKQAAVNNINKKGEELPSMKLFLSSEEQKKIWKVRDSGLGATAFVPGLPDAWEGWEDAAVPPEKVSDYLLAFRKLLDKYHYDTTMYGHFGQGCIHCRINFDFRTKEGIENYKQFTNEAADLVVSIGGSLSGEHGDGQSRGELLYKMFGKELVNAFREFKLIWDPNWKMNPGKIVDAFPRDSNLRLGANHRDREVETYFKYPDDKGSFARASLRCVGVGECRKTDGGTMCPSYMVTRDEKHSTRGRAHLLFEMMKGEVITDKWKDKNIKESLDLCLSCKGCEGECPVNVDVATYKAEFLAHYYQGKFRPRSAYAFGLIYRWAKIASGMPGFVNFFSSTFPFKNLFKLIAGIAPQRKIPLFANETFRRSFDNSTKIKQSLGTVMLWPDTFNNYFFPPTLKAATQILEHAGFEIKIPKGNFCCGRPLYDFGMLKTAKHLLEEILTKLSKDIQDEIPFIGLEPSCVAVFRNELLNLFPNDDNAKKLSKNFFTLAEFMQNHKENFQKLSGGNKKGLFESQQKAVYHGHCHHKAIMSIEQDQKVLNMLGLDNRVIDAGCCGLAGSFGFERGEKYDISMKAGERVLFPTIRELNDNDIIIADGFSCREQILHGTGKKAQHLAEVILSQINTAKY